MSSSSTSPQQKYDVFVSFRGKDVRDAFLAYLKLWLNLEGFSYFCDEELEHVGNKTKDTIFPAIHESRVALIVLSKNYADSKWCLDELVEILCCKSEHKILAVIPVFYGVETADVWNLPSESDFGQAFKRLRQKVKDDQQIRIWKDALRDVKSNLGLEKKKFRGEPELLDAIVHSLRKRILPRGSLHHAKRAIGADRLAKDAIPLLKISPENVRMIGISGTKGIGKTIVARAVCKGTFGQFERFIFLDKVGETEDHDFINLQKKLLQNLNGKTPCDNSPSYTEMIKNNLHHKKILLVLDGVTNKNQMEKLGVKERSFFRLGSRILITTRDRELLKDLKVDDEYIVEGLNRDEAFRLFCLHAFGGQEEPIEGFEELSRHLAHYAGGHPSALEEWGSFLKPTKDDWQAIKSDWQAIKGDWQAHCDELVKNPESIYSIREKVRPFFKEYPCSVVGQCGGDRRKETWKDNKYTGVKKIEVGVDSEGIKFINVHYDKNGCPQKTVKHGIMGGQTSTRTIEVDYPGEYFIYMSGHSKKGSRCTIVQSLTLYTNKGNREFIGIGKEGRKFSFSYTGHKIVGFQGSCSNFYLESIEAIYKRVSHTPIDHSGGLFGRFGGAGEKSWDSNHINGISVSYAGFISYITFKVDCRTSSRPTYRRSGRKNTFEVKLKMYEYITSFSGYLEKENDSRILIKSLTFQTNKRILGPIGREEGKHFSSPSPSEAAKVIRFFGRTDEYLESIGAEVQPFYPFEFVGLYASSNASIWDDRIVDCTNVITIIVEFEPRERFIRSITFHYKVENETSLREKNHPGSLAEVVEPRMINIDADEYLTLLSGYYTDRGITSLTFRTTKRMLEPIGCEEGIHFSSPATGGKIVGFYGRSGENLEAIGAYFKPISDYPVKSIGPFGVLGGRAWAHGKFNGVREIKVKHHNYIHHIKFVYDNQSHAIIKNGNVKEDNPTVTTVKLSYPGEYLTSISGYTENGAIQSLTFHSNKGRHGPFGKETGKYFWYPSNGSRITGFHGTQDPNNNTLKSIGVHVEPIPRMYPFKIIGPFGGSDGTPWDDGVHTDVRGFRISFGKAGKPIKAIGIAYDDNGSFVSGSEHGIGYVNKGSFVLGLKPGNKPQNKYEEVILDYPKERLLSIWVWVDQPGNTGQIHDLQIVTTDNNQTYGPFIQTKLTAGNKLKKCRIPSEKGGGRIVGFFGTVEKYLNSIGARLEPY